MGLLSLEQLLFYCESCPTEAKMVFDTQNKADNEYYYPVATAGVIVSSLVLNAVETVVKGGEICPCLLSTTESLNKVSEGARHQ
jgi:hypothetical protein